MGISKWWNPTTWYSKPQEEEEGSSDSSDEAEATKQVRFEEKDDTEKKVEVDKGQDEEKARQLFIYRDEAGKEWETDFSHLDRMTVRLFHCKDSGNKYPYIHPYLHSHEWEYLDDINVANPKPRFAKLKGPPGTYDGVGTMATKIMSQSQTANKIMSQPQPVSSKKVPSPQKSPATTVNLPVVQTTTNSKTTTPLVTRKPTISFGVPPPPPILSPTDEAIFAKEAKEKVAQYKEELRACFAQSVADGKLVPVGKDPFVSPYWDPKALAYVALYAFNARSQNGVPLAPDSEDFYQCMGSRPCDITEPELEAFKPLPIPPHMSTQSMFANNQLKHTSQKRKCHVCVGIGHLHDWIAYALKEKNSLGHSKAPGDIKTGVNWEELEKQYIVPLQVARPNSLDGTSAQTEDSLNPEVLMNSRQASNAGTPVCAAQAVKGMTLPSKADNKSPLKTTKGNKTTYSSNNWAHNSSSSSSSQAPGSKGGNDKNWWSDVDLYSSDWQSGGKSNPQWKQRGVPQKWGYSGGNTENGGKWGSSGGKGGSNKKGKKGP